MYYHLQFCGCSCGKKKQTRYYKNDQRHTCSHFTRACPYMFFVSAESQVEHMSKPIFIPLV